MLLTNDFIAKYKDKKPPFTPLGEFVYYRTYSRWSDDLGRRENWGETIRRAVEYNVGLAVEHAKKEGLDIPIEVFRKEAEDLYDSMYNLRQFLSGRTLWVGGTDVAKKFPLANFNCSFLILNSFEDFAQLFYLLMVGTGAGVRILREDVEKIPAYRCGTRLIITPYIPVPKEDRQELTDFIIKGSTALITVGDSKEGWVSALRIYFDLIHSHLYRDIKTIQVNFNNVRPKGERLKTFGGTASGHESLKNMFIKIFTVLQDAGGKLRPIHALDIANIIGENVVVGGVRRTSEIVIFDADEEEVLKAKENLYTQNETGEWVENEALSHRKMSNNSIWFTKKPERAQLSSIFKSIRFTGEPGFINAKALLKRRPDGKGTNPCGEILLDDNQTCNLTTTNVMAFVDENGELDSEALKDAMRLSIRAGMRMTLVDLEIDEWSRVQQRDRLTGVSMTGWQDMINASKLDEPAENGLLSALWVTVKAEAERYAKELSIREPLLATTIKPEGSLSQLPTVSSGLHYSHSPYYIRRVRINSHDPLVKVAEELGWVVQVQDENTKVIEFPVKSPQGRTKYEVSAIEQLENYKRFMRYYVDHNASITVSVRDHEWEAVEQWVWDNWQDIIGITFLSLTDHVYQLAPYEAISEEEYQERLANMKPFSAELLQKHETGEEFALEDSDCEAGVCPIR